MRLQEDCYLLDITIVKMYIENLKPFKLGLHFDLTWF